MRTPAPNPRAGTRRATTSRLLPLLLSCAAATSLATAASAQDGTVVFNDQELNGSVFADGQLIVEDVAGLASSTTAVGNSANGSVEQDSLDFDSEQRVSGSVAANSSIQVYGSSGEVFVNNTSATGNTGDANQTSGYTTARVNQQVGHAPVTANAFSRVTGSVDYASGSSTAIGNSHGYAAVNGSVEARTTQVNQGGAQAYNEAVLCCIQGAGTFTATAVSNNMTSAVENGMAYHEVTQRAHGDTRAVNVARVVTGNHVTGAATASGNLAHSSNTVDIAEIQADQRNSGHVGAESYVTLDHWYGTGASIAYGVGNSVSLVNVASPDPIMDTSQVNDGDVSTVALFDGGSGQDVFTSATSIGNTVSGFAEGVIDANNRQVNNGAVRSSARTYVAGGAGFVTSTSTAIGNTASYEARSPGN